LDIDAACPPLNSIDLDINSTRQTTNRWWLATAVARPPTAGWQ